MSLRGGKTIAFLGCGWLGFPLAQELLHLGYKIKASTTALEKVSLFEKEGFQPYLIDIYDQKKQERLDDFLKADILIVSVPFRRNLEDPLAYPLALESICKNHSAQHCLFTSSTSVYEPDQKICDEGAVLDFSPRPQALVQTEQVFMQQTSAKNTVLRLGGLYGPGREPGRFLRGKTNLPHPHKPVNLVHLQDVVNVCVEVIQQEAWGHIFNVVSDSHPTREEFYKAEAERLGVDSPTFREDSSEGGKVVDNTLLKDVLGYRFYF